GFLLPDVSPKPATACRIRVCLFPCVHQFRHLLVLMSFGTGGFVCCRAWLSTLTSFPFDSSRGAILLKPGIGPAIGVVSAS
ncbi:hypothetical protein SJS82_12885, partial [Aeromonas media]